MSSSPSKISVDTNKKLFRSSADIMKLVRMAQKSGDVLVDVAHDGRVTVRSVGEAVNLALKKKLSGRFFIILLVFLAFFLGILTGLIFNRVIFYDSYVLEDKKVYSKSVDDSDLVYFSDYETDTLVNPSNVASEELQLGEDFFKKGEFEMAYKSWKRELLQLPEETKVIVTGVYSSEAMAFKVYKSLAKDFRPILIKRTNNSAVQILILVPHLEASGFETTRRQLSTRLSITLPKWNSAKTLKKRLETKN